MIYVDILLYNVMHANPYDKIMHISLSKFQPFKVKSMLFLHQNSCFFMNYLQFVVFCSERQYLKKIRIYSSRSVLANFSQF